MINFLLKTDCDSDHESSKESCIKYGGSGETNLCRN